MTTAAVGSGEDRPRGAFRAWAPWLGALLLLGVLSIVLLAPLSTRPADVLYSPPASGTTDTSRADVRLTAWLLSWGAHAFSSGRIANVFDANIFHPAPDSLASSENLLGAQVLFTPIRWIARGPADALNRFTVLTFLLCGLATWWCAYRMFGTHTAGAVAGVVFAFAPWRIFALVHVQLLSVMYLPLIVWAARAGGSRRTLGIWLVLAGGCFLQGASSLYLGYMGFLAAGVIGAVTLVSPGARLARSLFIGSAIVAAILALLPLALPYVGSARGDAMFGRAMFNTLNSLGYLYPPVQGHPELGWAAWYAVPPLALAGLAVGALGRHRSLVVSLALLLVVAAWISAGPLGSWLGVPVGRGHQWLAAVVPGWSSVRGFARFAILAWLALSLLAALPFGRLGPDRESIVLVRVQRAVAFVLVALLAYSTWRIPIEVEPAPELGPSMAAFEWLKDHGGGDPVLHIPRQLGSTDASYMYLGTHDFSPMLNGYGGYAPPVTQTIEPLIQALPSPGALAAFERLGLARFIVVHTGRLSPREVRAFENALREHARDRGPQHAIYELPGYERGLSDAILGSPGTTALRTPIAPLGSAALRARVRTAFRKHSVRPGGKTWIMLDVENVSRTTWPALAASREGLVELELETRKPGSQDAQLRGVARLPFDVGPGQHARVRCPLRAPAEPGEYRVVPCVGQRSLGTRRCAPDDAFTLEVLPRLE